jgi:hypothetical protein
MTTEVLLKYALSGVLLTSAGTFALMLRRRLVREFYFLAALLCVLFVEEGISIATLFFRPELGISRKLDYQIYAYSHWICFFLEYALLTLVIYSVFRKAMKPLEGLHRAGKIIFRWISGVSLGFALIVAVGPHSSSTAYISGLTAQVQQGVSILILCLLLFVCFSTRYLGLTYRSHIFGITLGLGVFATVSLVETAWYSTASAQSLYSPVYVFSSLGCCVALMTWGTYFAMPEPKRQMVLLPTTSPFFLWNSISEALGDAPGFVAIAGFNPEMLAPAELTVLKAASKKVREREAMEEQAEVEATAMTSPHASLNGTAVASMLPPLALQR